MTVKINGKNYEVKPFTFLDCLNLEDRGFNILKTMSEGKIFQMGAMAVCAIADVSREDASFLIEQHIAGGGDLSDIIEKFVKAMEESDFFKKAQQNAEKAETVKKK